MEYYTYLIDNVSMDVTAGGANFSVVVTRGGAAWSFGAGSDGRVGHGTEVSTLWHCSRARRPCAPTRGTACYGYGGRLRHGCALCVLLCWQNPEVEPRCILMARPKFEGLMSNAYRVYVHEAAQWEKCDLGSIVCNIRTGARVYFDSKVRARRGRRAEP